MAHVQTNSMAPTLFARIADRFKGVGAMLVNSSEASVFARRIERFHAISDAELKTRGLSREEIITHLLRAPY